MAKVDLYKVQFTNIENWVVPQYSVGPGETSARLPYWISQHHHDAGFREKLYYRSRGKAA